MQENLSNSHETIQQDQQIASHASLDERLGSGFGAQSLPNTWQLEPISPCPKGSPGVNGVREANQFLKASSKGPWVIKETEKAGAAEAGADQQRTNVPMEHESLYGVKGRRDNIGVEGQREFGQRMLKNSRTLTSDGQDESSSRDFNDDDINSPSARASFANFDENLKGDQIELKYFLTLSDQFNSFKVLKR